MQESPGAWTAPALVGEFGIALEEEIKAAREAAASRAVQLSNGRSIGHGAQSFQYVFSLESPLSAPDDSPADLHVPGRTRLEATIVAIEGVRITLGVAEDLGAFVPRATLQSDMTILLRKLIERLEPLSGKPNSAGMRLLGARPYGEPANVHVTGLNQGQTEALASSLGRDTTFIWGPPGTGKTFTIGAIAAELFGRGRSVLVVSHTNIAVDGAILQIDERLTDEATDGLVLRVGEPRDQRLTEKHRLLVKTHVEERERALLEQRDSLSVERTSKAEEFDEIVLSLRLCEWVADAEARVADIKTALATLSSLEADALGAADERDGLLAQLEQWERVEAEASTATRQADRVRNLANEERNCSATLERALGRLGQIRRQVEHADEEYTKAAAMNPLLRRWRRLPKPEDQLATVTRLRAEQRSGEQDVERLHKEHASIQAALQGAHAKVAEFTTKHGGQPEAILDSARAYKARCEEVAAKAAELHGQAEAARDDVADDIREQLDIVRELGLSQGEALDIQGGFALLQGAWVQVSRETRAIDTTMLRERETLLHAEIKDIDREIAQIEEALQKVEELVIAEATVVATTLTRAYLRDSIQARRFDTVILDEASMAPMPALWLVAALADNVIVVGDFRQLAPIHQSSHVLAEKWLGTDVFDHSGMKADYEAGRPPAHFYPLTEQRRMHPAISALVKESYRELEDHPSTIEDDSASPGEQLSDWYEVGWPQDTPVLLVDTGSLNAWVTSVPSGRSASRLNFLSAATAVNLAERLLLPGRSFHNPGDDPRIIIGTPYRAQAILLNLMIHDAGLDGEVVAGTAHQFQGSEAPVAIFDFVNDEPHWRVGMFDMKNDDSTRRLLTVALTRAKRRLILIGDFQWITRNTRPGSFLRRLVERVRDELDYPAVDVRDLGLDGLASRAEQAQIRSFGGTVEAEHARVVMTQDDFYRLLAADLERARERVVIYSPFMTEQRVGSLEPALRAAIDRGVPLYVVTKALAERGKRESSSYSQIEAALKLWSVTVIHKLHMHEKLVFVDRDILWSGSLNPLSFGATQEVMERRQSRRVADDYSKTLRLDSLLQLFDSAESACPICGRQLSAAEGRNEPFYWRCIDEDCHYTRSIDQPAPRDGRIVCANCGGPVYFGEWGGEPYWRCEVNVRHRQRIAPSHLRLPKMRAIIPRGQLGTLDRRFETLATTRSGRGARP